MELAALHLERWRTGAGGEILALPVVYGTAEFAATVRAAVLALAPPAVAVEWPDTVARPFLRAVRRLPKVTVLAWNRRNGGILPHLVEPADARAEAVRTACECGIPVEFVDADLDRLLDLEPPYPDPHVLTVSSHREYVAACLGAPAPPLSRVDDLRCRHMAHRLEAAADRGGPVLFVCAIHRLGRVREALASDKAEVLRKSGPRETRIWHAAADSLPGILVVPPFVQAVYESRRNGVPAAPDLDGSTVRRKVGRLELIRGTADWDEEKALDDAIAWIAANNGPDAGRIDRQRAYLDLATVAARHYAQETSETVEAWQRRGMFRFLRNLALLEGRVTPDLASFVEAARSFADDNYMYDAWRLAVRYPWQAGAGELPEIDLPPGAFRMGQRTLRIRRRIRQPKMRRFKMKGRGGGKGDSPSEWLRAFDPRGICSYVPESVNAEKFRRWARGKAVKVLSEESARTEPFRGSLLDGIDLRETIRHLPEGEIWVKQFQRVRGGAENVVLIFEEDPPPDRYPHRFTWLGEHGQEADEAFYSTAPLDHVVGPGICRCEYGGFLHSYPPGRLDDVWSDPDYEWTRTPAERLLAAAIDYSTERHVVYVAPAPPRPFLKQYAARRGRTIVYLPSGTVSPVTRKKLRVMHMLFGHDKRRIADRYVW